MKRFLPQTLSMLALSASATLASSAQAQSVLPSCPAMKTGTYVALNPLDPDPAWRVNVLSINGDTLTVTDRDGSQQLGATPTLCQFTLPNGGPLVMSRKSTFMFRGTDPASGVFSGFGMPLKKVPFADMVGTWNFMRREPSDTVVGSATYNGQVSISSTGQLTVSTCDSQGGNCSGVITGSRLRVNTAGGFTMTNSDGKIERFFALKTANGEKVVVGVGIDHDAFTVMAPPTPRTLPAVGARWAQWEMTHGWNGTISNVDVSSYRVVASDPVTQQYKRRRLENCRLDTWTVNSGRDGMNYRAAGQSKDCSGAPLSYGSNLAMTLRETFGFTVFGYEPANGQGFFGIAIDKP